MPHPNLLIALNPHNQILVGISHHDGVEVVVVPPHTDFNLLYLLVLRELVYIFQGHSVAHLRRLSPIAEREFQRGYRVNGGPLYLSDSQRAQDGLLLEYLELGIPECFKVRPLGLLEEVLMMPIGAILLNIGTQVFYGLVKIKFRVRPQKDLLVDANKLLEIIYDFLAFLLLILDAVFFLVVQLTLEHLYQHLLLLLLKLLEAVHRLTQLLSKHLLDDLLILRG